MIPYYSYHKRYFHDKRLSVRLQLQEGQIVKLKSKIEDREENEEFECSDPQILKPRLVDGVPATPPQRVVRFICDRSNVNEADRRALNRGVEDSWNASCATLTCSTFHTNVPVDQITRALG